MTKTVFPLQTILQAVATEFGVTVQDIESPHRLPEYVMPRQVAFYLAKNYTRLSLPQIGRRIGDRDCSTVGHAIRVVEGRKDGNPALGEAVVAIERKLLGRDPPGRYVGLSPEIFAVVQKYARRHKLRAEVAANELLRFAAGADAR